MTLKSKIDIWLLDTTKQLTIRSFFLTKWPKCLLGKESLIVDLDCSQNNLTVLPKGMVNLRILTCYDNKLTTLPNDMINLVYLECSSNKLIAIPNFSKLKSLNCGSNQLLTLPDSFPALSDLGCENNQLTVLPKYLPNIIDIYCHLNQLTTIPEYLNKGMQILDCNNNLLKFLPDLSITYMTCYNNDQLFSEEQSDWKKLWAIKAINRAKLRDIGLSRVIKVLKNRLYLPRLTKLHQELIWSPNHPGKFFKLLPKVGIWM